MPSAPHEQARTREGPLWVKNGYVGHSTGMSPVPPIADDFVHRPIRSPPRDFVPWRFSDACRHAAWISLSCRRPKTCTKEDLRLLRLAHDLSALRSVCASAISGNSGVGEKPLSADTSKAKLLTQTSALTITVRSGPTHRFRPKDPTGLTGTSPTTL